MKWGNRIALIALTIAAFLSIGRILTKARSGIDFFSLIWYPGHFVWQRVDPYMAALENWIPDLPVRYWDGGSATDFPFSNAMPTNLAPLVLLFAPLARLSWHYAMTSWILVNVGLLPVVAWTVAHLLGYRLFSRETLLLFLILCSLIATRQVIETGQTTLVTFSCMLLALVLGPSDQNLAGILLGIALSKYSLTFPGALYFLYKRWYRGLAISLGVQLAGLLAIAAVGRTSPQAILGEYIQIMLKHTNMPGQHLMATLLSWGPVGSGIVGLLSVSLFLVLTYWHRNFRPNEPEDDQTASMTFLVAIMQWNLIALPHRRHDHVVEIMFIALVILWARKESRRFLLSDRQSKGLCGLAGLAMVIWIFPLYYLMGTTVYSWVFAFFSLMALGISVWLLFRVPYRLQGKER